MMEYREGMYWGAVKGIDIWLDDKVSSSYKDQPLAQDWGRVAKIGEELGEVIAELILWTGQNPRKGTDITAHSNMLEEIADVVCTATLCLQHFTKNETQTRDIIRARMNRIWDRALSVNEYEIEDLQ